MTDNNHIANATTNQKQPEHLTLENLLYGLALVIAVILRLYHLGAAPLSNREADWALQAYYLSDIGTDVKGLPLTAPPAYVIPTSILFTLFGSSDILARLLPVVVGSLLTLVPIPFRGKLGKTPALILAFGLAIDPGLVEVSRQASGPMLALGFSLIALALWKDRKATLAGISLGLALLSGPAVLIGLLGLLVTTLILRLSKPMGSVKAEQNADSKTNGEESSDPQFSAYFPKDWKELRTALITSLVTALLASTLFFKHPQGLGAWLNMFPLFLEGMINFSGIPAQQLVAALVAFQPLALFFALLGLGRWLYRSSMGYTVDVSRTAPFLIWVLVSLVLALVYPGRLVSDLCWTLIPLWALAAIELAEYVPQRVEKWITPVFAVLILILLGAFWLELITTQHQVTVGNLPWNIIHLAKLISLLLLGLLASIMVTMVWTWETGQKGLVWGLWMGLTIYIVGAMWGASQLRPNLPQELWSPPPATGQAELLTDTLQDLAYWENGLPGYLDIVSTVDTPSLRWSLRNFSNVQFVPSLPIGETPSVVITKEDQDTLKLAASYRGQDFDWWIWPGWSGALPPEALSWLAFRQAPLLTQKVILWARADIFTGGTLMPEPSPEDILEDQLEEQP